MVIHLGKHVHIQVGKAPPQLNEHVSVLGRIIAHATPPDLTKEEYEKWWPRLSKSEQDRYAVYETHNIIDLNGRTNILNYIGNDTISGTGTTGTQVVPFAQYFSVGTGAIALISAGDTTMVGELFRAQPSSATVSGNSVNISTFFGSGSANGVYTNAGLYGGAATGTLGSGTLQTHALYTFTKTSANSLVTSYVITLN